MPLSTLNSSSAAKRAFTTSPRRRAVRPAVVVALGATAAQTLPGPAFRLKKHRGEVFSSDLHPRVVATVHPSSILRAPDDDARHDEMAKFIADLKRIPKLVRSLHRTAS